METPANTSGNTEQSLMKKLKGFDGLAVSMGNGNAKSGGAGNGLSQRFVVTQFVSFSDHWLWEQTGWGMQKGSSDRSDGNTAVDQSRRKRHCEGNPSIGNDGKFVTRVSHIPGGEANASSGQALEVTATPISIAGKPMGTVPLLSMNTALDLGVPQVRNQRPVLVFFMHLMALELPIAPAEVTSELLAAPSSDVPPALIPDAAMPDTLAVDLDVVLIVDDVLAAENLIA
ncbi:hypothetical protein HHK36_001254 [Tetracentron sinense]|uniref:Uncharacterized protein n=1 Tax=Tetracentron sinense TaxID=13715 RepID=A0A835DQZ3_TETSI|nr:hypothetical protein HHK36_001254 [Tetracentron sinense]